MVFTCYPVSLLQGHTEISQWSERVCVCACACVCAAGWESMCLVSTVSTGNSPTDIKNPDIENQERCLMMEGHFQVHCGCNHFS